MIAPVEPGPAGLFGCIAASTTIAAVAIHRLASRRVARGPAWDCGFPDASPITQSSADGFAQSLRRVFATLVLRSRETVDMPAPGDARAATIVKSSRDLVWNLLCTPPGRPAAWSAGRPRH
jgi:hypothetical protein